MFDKMKQLMEMQKKMQEVKRQLDSANFDVTSADKSIRITMNGSQEVKAVSILVEPGEMQKAALERAIKDVYNSAIKESHELAAQKMKDVTGFNLPGLT